MIKGIYGINVAVKDLAEATKKYEAFFGIRGESLEPQFFAFPGLRGTQFKIGGFHLNLITSEQPGTSVAKFLEKHGDGFFLLSVEVDDIEADVARLRGTGAALLMDNSITGDFGAVNFVHPKSMAGVQVEIYAPTPDLASK